LKLLLDTHALLWILGGDDRLSEGAATAFEDPANEAFVSAVSLWEIAIKLSLGKLELSPDWFPTIQAELENNRIAWLPLRSRHCVGVTRLPFHHRDPFDRMLVVQATTESMSLVTRDRWFRAYDVSVVW
jgi:PIN domain nuclease of toxin-antitoxin system